MAPSDGTCRLPTRAWDLVLALASAIRLSLRRDRPYGADSWTTETAGLLGLEYSLRHRERQHRH